MQNVFKRKIAKGLTIPEEIDNILKESLEAYLNGEVTEAHLARLLKQQLHGQSSKLSFKVVQLLPQFRQLLDLLKKDLSPKIEDKKIINYVLKKLANQLYLELST